ncbi:MAG: VOC family protein, partial [Gammaproteobacteria bacterium]
MNDTSGPNELSTPQPRRHPDPTVRAQRLAYLMFERPDLGLATRFLTDFGLTVVSADEERVVLRGTSSEPLCYVLTRGESSRFAGLALRVGTAEDLAALAALPGASPVRESTLPGGGSYVELRDPCGFRVRAVQGQTPAAPLPTRAPLSFNAPGQLARVNATQRPAPRPPEVVGLGHVALEAADYQATSAWYTEHFGFIPSDVQVLPDGSPAVAFMRLDLGAVPADHHTLALVQGFAPAFNHAAFEVVDADAVGMGQRVLRERGWRHAWGIGRHVLGS